MAIVNRKYGYLFLAEPYCASRTVAQSLLTHEGSEQLDCWVHEPLAKLCEMGLVQPNESLLKFSIVRHPCDYLVTKYHHLTGWHKKGFREFLRHHLENPETLFMHAASADMTLKFELLNAQLNDILEARGAPPVQLQVVGKTADKKDWRSYYSVGDIWHIDDILPDFKTFGYRTH